MSFLSSLVWGICSVIMVTVICASALVFYSLAIVDTKADSVVELVEDLIGGDIPGIAKSVPILADALNNERRLEYVDDLDISVRLDEHPQRHDLMQAVVSVANEGQEQVSLLCMRVVITDGKGRIVDEDTECIATPIPLDDNMPGPLLPGYTRRLTVGTFKSIEDPSAEYEISEIRVWAKEGVEG